MKQRHTDAMTASGQQVEVSTNQTISGRTTLHGLTSLFFTLFQRILFCDMRLNEIARHTNTLHRLPFTRFPAFSCKPSDLDKLIHFLLPSLTWHHPPPSPSEVWPLQTSASPSSASLQLNSFLYNICVSNSRRMGQIRHAVAIYLAL